MTLRGPLPRLLLIADRFTDPAVSERILRAAAGGLHWIQLRDHEAAEDSFLNAADRLVSTLRAMSPDLLISVNSRVGVAERLACAAHVGHRGPGVADARSMIPEGLPVGRSVHDLEELRDLEADYLIWSPVFETRSKPGHAGTGLDILASACRHAESIPVIAMGGVSPENTADCLRAGAYGVAVLSGILGHEKPDEAVARYRHAIEYPEG